MNPADPEVFSLLHIDIARNSTDDFNLFHDRIRWSNIARNPFGGPIALGFQLESLIEGKIESYRDDRNEQRLIAEHGLHFSNYQFVFANAVRPGQCIDVEIRASQFRTGPPPSLANRVLVKADGRLALTGYKRETTAALYPGGADFSRLAALDALPDRSFVDSGHFLKRKFMMTSNAKNFLCGSLRDQTRYFDELRDRVRFPEMFPCALLSSALLEKAVKLGHDFERNPMVYTSHRISIDRRLLATLRSNDVLHLLIKQAGDGAAHDFGGETATALDYECYGLINPSHDVIFGALISLAPLTAVDDAGD